MTVYLHVCIVYKSITDNKPTIRSQAKDILGNLSGGMHLAWCMSPTMFQNTLMSLIVITFDVFFDLFLDFNFPDHTQ